jgi:uncharacterized protein (DUF2141 family)
VSKKDRRKIRASCTAALAQARWLISLEHGRRLLARLLAMRGSVARGAAAGTLAAALALTPVRASGPFTSEAPLGSGRPAFVDIDDDGDLDAFVGTIGGTIRYFRNEGSADTFAFPQAFAEQTGADNPFDGIDFGSFANLAFTNIDGDGKPDAIIGSEFQSLRYFRNTSALPTLSFIEATVPDNLTGVGTGTTPTFADLDGDLDQDLFLGQANGTIAYYRNDSGTFSQQTGTDNPFNGVDVGFYALVDFGDLNNDGFLDAVLANNDGQYTYLQNSGTIPIFGDQTGVTNPFAGIDFRGPNGIIALADMDGDDDEDAFLGQKSDAILFYRNTSNAETAEFTPDFGNPLLDKDVGGYARPVFADIDGDGDLDAFVGERNGSVIYYRNNGSSTQPDFVNQSGVSNPLATANVAYAAAPALVDINNNDALDAFIGESTNSTIITATIEHYANQGDTQNPSFTQLVDGNNPLSTVNGFTSDSFAAPAFVDFDNDGRQDVFVGRNDGTVLYYQNTSVTTETLSFQVQSGNANPLNGLDVGTYAMPTFVDFDNDGDQDAFIGSKSDTVLFYRNDGGTLTEDTGINNPFQGQTGMIAPAFADIDGDGDPDAFAGRSDGTIDYFENLAVPTAPDALSATAASSSRIDLSWADNSDNETGFVIQRSPDGTAGSWTQIATPAADATSFSDTGLAENTAYYYRIQAVNGNFSSPVSATANATTGAEAPPAPGNLNGNSNSSSEATISWDAPTGNVGGFIVERSSDGGQTWTEVANLPADDTSFTDENVEPDSEYQYRVITVGSDGAPNSPPSDPVTVTTDPAEEIVYLPLIFRAP